MNVLSLFSGVGGFDLGLERAGMTTVFQCEWDKHCLKVLNRHWSDVPKWDNIETLTGKYILENAPIIDVVAWGSPCQDLSLAKKKRTGLQGERSGLFYEGIRIIKELRELTNGQYPRISIWENVAGALSSNNGADFGEILYQMDEAGANFSEWVVLDAQHFRGTPQRRRRVFVVSVFDSAIAARSPEPLFTLGESLHRDSKTSKPPKQDSAITITSSAGSGRQCVEPFTASSFAQYKKGVGTLRSNGGDLGGGSETVLIGFSHTQGLDSQPSEIHFPTLRKEGNGHAVLEKMNVRRLTPTECERLMGWPDNWTDGQTDGHRYRQCGNGVASPVATWIGLQLIKLLDIP